MQAEGYHQLASLMGKLHESLKNVPSSQKAIVLIGPPSSGKTCLSYPILRQPLWMTPDRQYRLHEQERTVQISNNPMTPKITKVPFLCNTYVVETPLIFQADPQAIFLGYCYLQRLIQKFRMIKVVLVGPLQWILDKKFASCLQTVKGFLEYPEDNLWLCVSKVEHGKNTSNVIKNVRQVLQNQSLTLGVVEKIVENDHLILFRQPSQDLTDFGAFSPLTEDTCWSIPKALCGNHPDYQQLSKKVVEYLGLNTKVVEELIGLFMPIVRQAITKTGNIVGNFKSIGQVQGVISSVAVPEMIPLKQFPKVRSDCQKYIPHIAKRYLESIGDLESTKLAFWRIGSLILGKTSLPRQQAHSLIKFLHLLQSKLQERLILSRFSKALPNIQPHLKLQQELLWLNQATNACPTFQLQNLNQKDYLLISEFLTTSDEYYPKLRKLYKLSHESADQLVISMRYLVMSGRLHPLGNEEVVSLYQRVGDLLLGYREIGTALSCYKAVFNQTKIMNIIQKKKLGQLEVLEIGDYFLENGFLHGVELYKQVLKKGSPSMQAIATARMRRAQQNRQSTLQKLKERVKNKAFVLPISNLETIIEEVRFVPFHATQWLQSDQQIRQRLQHFQRLLSAKSKTLASKASIQGNE